MTQSKNETKGVVFGIFTDMINSNNRVHRISSMFLDHILLSLMFIPLAVILTITSRNIEWIVNHETGHLGFYLLVFIYLNKDFFRGKGPAKRVLGYQIINQKTGKPANELQCFVRNLTICVAWPLEVVIGFINPERRIGDFIANTHVVKSEKENLKSIYAELKKTKPKISFIRILILAGIYFYSLDLIFEILN